MMEFKLYRCAVCGNIAWKIVDKGVPLFCCGEKMEEAVPGTSEGATEKHLPVLCREGEQVTVAVGETLHPMEEAHSIQLIAAVSGDTAVVRRLKPGDQPVLTLTAHEPVTAYAYCDLHGYWSAREG